MKAREFNSNTNSCVTSSCAGPPALLCRCSACLLSPPEPVALGTPGPGSVLGRVSTEQHSVLPVTCHAAPSRIRDTSTAAGDTNLCRTQHPECSLHITQVIWWRGNIISILGGREFLRHCKRAGVEWVGLRPSVPGWRLSLMVLVWSGLCELRGAGLGDTQVSEVGTSEKTARGCYE